MVIFLISPGLPVFWFVDILSTVDPLALEKFAFFSFIFSDCMVDTVGSAGSTTSVKLWRRLFSIICVWFMIFLRWPLDSDINDRNCAQNGIWAPFNLLYTYHNCWLVFKQQLCVLVEKYLLLFLSKKYFKTSK